MARRRVLTGEQLEELLALPASKPVLIRHWTLYIQKYDCRRKDFEYHDIWP
jgi:hypothetical protein